MLIWNIRNVVLVKNIKDIGYGVRDMWGILNNDL